MDSLDAVRYLASFLGKTLHIQSLDGRLFVGSFRCVDNENNVILSNAYEYRLPSDKAHKAAQEQAATGIGAAKANMTSRFLGLIVVPGKQIVKLEVEERAEMEGERPLPLRPKD